MSRAGVRLPALGAGALPTPPRAHPRTAAARRQRCGAGARRRRCRGAAAAGLPPRGVRARRALLGRAPLRPAGKAANAGFRLHKRSKTLLGVDTSPTSGRELSSPVCFWPQGTGYFSYAYPLARSPRNVVEEYIATALRPQLARHFPEAAEAGVSTATCRQVSSLGGVASPMPRCTKSFLAGLGRRADGAWPRCA